MMVLFFMMQAGKYISGRSVNLIFNPNTKVSVKFWFYDILTLFNRDQANGNINK